MNRRNVSLLTRCVFALSVMLSLPAWSAVGRTEGQFAVDANGAATYRIPLWLPSGPNGMQPDLALSYSSLRPNGVLGVGWALDGLSAIERCNRTAAQDVGFRAGVKLTYEDRYCLNGNRLRLLQGTGNYGDPGSVYQTELQTFATITAYGGSAATGPDYFIMRANDSRTYEFGRVGNSRSAPGTSNVAYRWKLNKVSDTAGNSYDIDYSNSLGGDPAFYGQAFPSTISWGVSTARYVARFNYTTVRLDTFTGKIATQVVSNNRRLESIQVENAAGNVIRKYKLGFNDGPVSKASRLVSVRECPNTYETDCLDATTIAYQSGTVVAMNATSTLSIAMTKVHPVPGDFNGDGFQDVLYADSSTWRVAFGSATGITSSVAIPGLPASQSVTSGRFAGNGRDGVLSTSGGVWNYYYHNGAGFVSVANVAPSPGDDSQLRDIDGDGLLDLVWRVDHAIYTRLNITASNAAVAAFSASSQLGFTIPNFTTLEGLLYSPTGFDIDGDGRQDLVYLRSKQNPHLEEPLYYAMLLLSRGTTFIGGGEINLAYSSDLRFINFNDDRCSDWISERRIKVSPCAETAGAEVASMSTDSIGTLDWDSDGRDDVMIHNTTTNTVSVYRSLGTALDSVALATSVPYTGAELLRAMDPNGDAVNDLVAVSAGTIATYKRSEIVDGDSVITAMPDLATSFTDGFGIAHSVKYTTTSRSNYTAAAGTDVLYPVSAALLVVKTVTAPTGSGGTFDTNFHYAGARVNASRGGLAGFESIKRVDSRNGWAVRTTYEQLFPKVGLVAKEEFIKPNGTTIPWTRTNTYQHHNYGQQYPDIGETRYFPYLQTSVEERRDPGSNALVATITTTNTVDQASGTATLSLTDVSQSAFLGSPAITFNIELSQQFLTSALGCSGRSTRTEEKRKINGLGAIIRSVNTVWDTTYCRPTDVITEPDYTDLKVTNHFEYDTFGNTYRVTRSADPIHGLSSRVTTANWGTTGQYPGILTNAKNQQTTVDWNLDLGVPNSVQAVNGATSIYDYDDFGRLESEIRADATKTVISMTRCNSSNGYCGGPNDLRVRIDAKSYNSGDYATVVRTESEYYDGFDRVRFSDSDLAKSNEISRVQQTYDVFGRLATRSVPNKLVGGTPLIGLTEFFYDDIGRLTKSERQATAETNLKISTTTAYSGLVEVHTDAEGKARTLTRDVFGRVMRAKDALSTETRYEYDPFGNLLFVYQGDNLTIPTLKSTTSMTYDRLGQRTRLTDPDTGQTDFTYFPFGELKWQRDAKLNQTWFYYDELSRMTLRKEAEGDSTYGYDSVTNNNGVGQLTSISGPGGSYSEALRYDVKGRLANRKITIGGTPFDYDYTYGVHGGIETVTYPQSTGSTRFAVEYRYSKGILDDVRKVGSSTPYWKVDESNARGQVTRAALGNGIFRTLLIDGVTGLTTKHLAGTSSNAYDVQNESYAFDYVGNLKSRVKNTTTASLTEDFNYDDLHRLQFSKLNGVENFRLTYDAIGNIKSRTDVAGAQVWKYDDVRTHQLLFAGPQSNPATLAYTYDANGNVNSRGGRTLQWTSYNYPREIDGLGKKLTFDYAPDRQRYRQVYEAAGAATETTLYLGDLLEKVDAGGVTDWRHSVSAGGQVVAIVSRKNPGTETTSYLLPDNLGSIAHVLSSSGANLVTESFAPFGARRNPQTWAADCPCDQLGVIKGLTRRGFTGHEMIGGASMGLIHMNGRVQDSLTGRFLSADPFVQDPYDSQSFNRYSYVTNNPLSYTDPSGFLKFTCTSSGGGGMGGSADINNNSGAGCFVDFDGYVNPGVHVITTLAVDRTPRRAPTGEITPPNPALVDATVGPSAPGINGVAVARTGASVIVGFIPIVGSLQSVAELITGRDYIAGEKTSRWMAAGGIVLGLVGAKGFLKVGEKVATHADDIVGAVSTVAVRTCCFVAGTLVMTEKGLRPIEEIEVGDLVLSRNEMTGETEFKPVTNLIRRHDREIWELTVRTADGSDTETFQTTDDHPWRTLDGRWVATAALQPGELIQSASGASVSVVSVVKTDRVDLTFNLEVADFHTYFVGRGGVWVHNTCWLENLLEYVNEQHHIFPQAKEFVKFFNDAKIDIHKWTITIDRGIHRDLTPEWHQRWQKFMRSKPDAKKEEIYEFAAELMDEFGLSSNLHPWKK